MNVNVAFGTVLNFNVNTYANVELTLSVNRLKAIFRSAATPEWFLMLNPLNLSPHTTLLNDSLNFDIVGVAQTWRSRRMWRRTPETWRISRCWSRTESSTSTSETTRVPRRYTKVRVVRTGTLSCWAGVALDTKIPCICPNCQTRVYWFQRIIIVRWSFWDSW